MTAVRGRSCESRSRLVVVTLLMLVGASCAGGAPRSPDSSPSPASDALRLAPSIQTCSWDERTGSLRVTILFVSGTSVLTGVEGADVSVEGGTAPSEARIYGEGSLEGPTLEVTVKGIDNLPAALVLAQTIIDVGDHRSISAPNMSAFTGESLTVVGGEATVVGARRTSDGWQVGLLVTTGNGPKTVGPATVSLVVPDGRSFDGFVELSVTTDRGQASAVTFPATDLPSGRVELRFRSWQVLIPGTLRVALPGTC